MTSEYAMTYKKILLLTNGHMEGYQSGGVINVSRWKTFRDIIAQFFAMPKGRGVDQGYAVHGKNNKMPSRALCYNPAKPTAFASLNKLSAALPNRNKPDIRAYLEHQKAYTMHRPLRKRFLRNPYTVTKLMDVW